MRDGEAEHDLAQRHPGVLGEQRAVLPERGRDFGGGGDEEVFDAEHVGLDAGRGDELPGAEQGRQQQRREQPAAHRIPSCRARIARSRAATKAGSVTAESRSRARARPAGASSSSTTRPGRAESTATRSAR